MGFIKKILSVSEKELMPKTKLIKRNVLEVVFDKGIQAPEGQSMMFQPDAVRKREI